jgi:DNA-binding XRE family transcriptional regulator
MTMAASYSIHPDDEQMLLKIRRYLIGYRITNGWTQEELSHLINGTTHTAARLEKGGFDWHLPSLQQWPIPFELKLKATPVFEGRNDETYELWSEIIEAHPLISTLQAALTQPLDNWMDWQRTYLTTYMQVAREVQGVARKQLARKMQITAGAISTWEINADRVRLVRLLNIARALGGTIRMELEE